MRKINKPYPNRLREFRVRCGLQQIDVARSLRLASVKPMSRWEEGRALPTSVNVLKLAVLYKAELAELYQPLREEIKRRLNRPIVLKK